MNKTFGKNIFVIFCAGALVISTNIFAIVLANKSLLGRLEKCLYLNCIIIELFSYCYFGQRLSEEVRGKNDCIKWKNQKFKLTLTLCIFRAKTCIK